ncbi:MAG: hypothetical protein PVG50_05935 [Thiohalophilus sp.]
MGHHFQQIEAGLMNSYSVKAGDMIRIVPKTYFDLCKAEFNNPSAWELADRFTNGEVMLGGRYEILEILDQQGRRFFRVLESAENMLGFVDESLTLPDQALSTCPYNVGDRVHFCLSRSEIHKNAAYLKHYEFGDPKVTHTINFVLNDCFVFLDFEIPDFRAFPFLWRHVERL